jgi:hypothetical protein
MNKEELSPWIEKLNAEPDGKKRAEIVAGLCKEKSLKTGDAWKLLKEAGFDPKAVPGSPEKPAGVDGGANPPDGGPDKAKAESEAQAKAAEEEAANAKTEPALLRHKTQYPKYRCAGLVLTQKAETYQVTESQLEKLRTDPWVVVEKEAAPK